MSPRPFGSADSLGYDKEVVDPCADTTSPDDAGSQVRFHRNDSPSAPTTSSAAAITNHTLISCSSCWFWMSLGNLAKTSPNWSA